MNKKKAEQLGMVPATAASRLRKMIMFELVGQVGLNRCYRCKERIENVEDLSVEHIIPWLDSDDPIKLYFDLSNIAFSHLSCNVKAGRKGRKPNLKDGNRNKKITLICAGCKKSFTREKWKVEKKRALGQENFYCTHECFNRTNGVHIQRIK